MTAPARRIVLPLLIGISLAVGGCYDSAVSLAKCTATYKTTESIAQAFAPGARLVARNAFGAVTVSGDDGADCRITSRMYVHAPTRREAEQIGRQVQVTTDIDGDTLQVVVERPHLVDKRSVWVDLIVTVPSWAHVSCETGFGEIEVTDVEGDVGVATEFGRITCRGLASRYITAKSGFGAIEITCTEVCPADLVADVWTGHGKVRFKAPEAFGGNLDIGTGFGSAKVQIPISSRTEWTDDRKMATTGFGEGRLSLKSDFGSVWLR